MRLITPFTPRALTSDLWTDMDRLFDEFKFTNLPAYDERQYGGHYTTATEIVEGDNHFMFSVDLPGLKKEDIKIEVQERTLTISGERKREEKSDKNVQRMEKYYGTFTRSYTLPTLVDAEKIEAHYQDGVLELYIPKVAAAQAKKIEIQSGKSGFFDKFLNVKKTNSEQKEISTAPKN